MSFIDDGLARQKEIKRRIKLISEFGPKIFTELWTQIVAYLDEGKTKGFKLTYNGAVYERLVEIDEKEHFRLILDLSKRKISARGDRGVNFEFVLDDSCPNGLVCLKHEGQDVTADEAAVLVLQRFLFPDLS